MKISLVKVSNFKRLKNFNLDLTDSNSNLAFVNGSNGNGKSTFLKTFRWCFFGEQISPLDFSFATLDTLEPGEISQILVEVRLQINEAGDVATVRREQSVRRTDSEEAKTVEFLGPEELSIIIAYANHSIPSEVIPDPRAWLESYLPQRFKRFILFDGELMYKFFDLSVKGAIEDAVREIAKIDLFDSVVQRLKEILTRNNQRVAKLSGAAAEGLERELKAKNDEKDRMTALLRSKRQEKDLFEVTINELQDKLRGKEELETFLETNRELREKLNAKYEHKKSLDASLSKNLLFTGVHNLLHARVKYPVEKHVREAEKAGKYPADFSPDALKRILEDKNCICGRHLAEDSAEAKSIFKIISDSQNSGDIGSELKKIEIGVSKVGGMLDKAQENYKFVISELKNCEIEIRRLTKEISDLQPRLEGVKGNHENILQLSKDLKTAQANYADVIREETLIISSLTKVTSEVNTIEKKFKTALGNSTEIEKLNTRSEFLSRAISQATTFSDEIMGTVRKQLEDSISKRFVRVQGCGNYKVSVTEDFDVNVFSDSGAQPELNEGSKMALAYIFSIALREVVGLSFPLIVDTPLGRVSSKNRAMLAEALYELVTSGTKHQVILMMHDGEYSPYTKRDFAPAQPLEAYLALAGDERESNLEFGIDPDWTTRDAWKDWAEGNIKL
jgi:DNA sulfur modification protein DndD